MTSDPLEAANELFHQGYGDARGEAQRTNPVLVLLGDELTLARGASRSSRAFTPPAFHRLKAAAHIPIALYALVASADGETLPDGTTARLTSMLDHIDHIGQIDRAPPDELDAEARDVFASTVETSKELIVQALTDRRVAPSRIAQFSHEMGPRLLGLTDHATRLRLDALHAAADELVASIPLSERGALHVVVAGDHQARARSLGMQYFQKRLGASAKDEHRVVYGENVTSVDEALALVGTLRLDRAIARAFFGDEERLQRDVLGDAAKRQLESFPKLVQRDRS